MLSIILCDAKLPRVRRYSQTALIEVHVLVYCVRVLGTLAVFALVVFASCNPHTRWMIMSNLLILSLLLFVGRTA